MSIEREREEGGCVVLFASRDSFANVTKKSIRTLRLVNNFIIYYNK